MASRRSVPRLALRLVGGCGAGDVITVRFPLVFCPLYGLVGYLHVWSSSSCVSRLRRWKRSNVLVVEFQDLSELGLCVVQGAVRPEPEDCLLCSSTAYRSKEESM